MDAPKYVIFEACDLYILENEQLDDAKMLTGCNKKNGHPKKWL